MKKLFLSFIYVLFIFTLSISGYGQEQKIKVNTNSDQVGGFVITVSPALTWVPQGANLDNLNEKGHFVPGLGADFFYRFLPKWEIGTMIDYEFDHYIIPRKNELERERAFVATLMFAYTINARWNIFAGAGMEFEKHENLVVGRFGGEYVIPLKKGWFIPVGSFIDFKPGFQSISLSIGIGKSL